MNRKIKGIILSAIILLSPVANAIYVAPTQPDTSLVAVASAGWDVLDVQQKNQILKLIADKTKADATNIKDVSIVGLATVGWDNLNTDDKQSFLNLISTQADVMSQQQKLKQEQEEEHRSMAKEVDDWVSVGEHAGKALGGAAKELNIAANEFANTKVGIFTMVLIAWKIMGGSVLAVGIHLLGALLILVVGSTGIYYLYKHMNPMMIEYDTQNTNWFGRPKIKSRTYNAWSDGGIIGFVISVILLLLLTLATMFSY